MPKFTEEFIATLNRDMNLVAANTPTSELPAFATWFQELEQEEPVIWNMYRQIYAGHMARYQQVGAAPFADIVRMFMLSLFYAHKAFEAKAEVEELEKMFAE